MELTESMLFDENGRCTPADLENKVHYSTRRYFKFIQPEIDYTAIYQRFDNYLGVSKFIKLDEFEVRAKAILAKLSKDKSCSNITKGVAVPFILPQESIGDIGSVFEERYLVSLKKSFEDFFPDYSFVNYCNLSFKGAVSITPNSRHEELIEAMQQGVVVGFYFPNLLEYSVPAAIEKVSKLPAQFLLAGGFDSAAAIIGSPDLLLRKDGYSPLLWLSGMSSDVNNVEYHFEAYGYDLTMNRRAHFSQVAEYWASGLVVLG